MTEFMVEGGLRKIMGSNNMEKRVVALKDHYLACGFGRTGKVICKNFQENNLPKPQTLILPGDILVVLGELRISRRLKSNYDPTRL